MPGNELVEAVFLQTTFSVFHVSIIRPVFFASRVHVYLPFLLPFQCLSVAVKVVVLSDVLASNDGETFSIRPAANRKLQGQKEGFIWDSRPPRYHHANRNGSSVPGVLPPDNVPRQQFCSDATLCMNGTDQTHYVTVHLQKKLFFPQRFRGMLPPAGHFSRVSPPLSFFRLS